MRASIGPEKGRVGRGGGGTDIKRGQEKGDRRKEKGDRRQGSERFFYLGELLHESGLPRDRGSPGRNAFGVEEVLSGLPGVASQPRALVQCL